MTKWFQLVFCAEIGLEKETEDAVDIVPHRGVTFLVRPVTLM